MCFCLFLMNPIDPSHTHTHTFLFVCFTISLLLSPNKHSLFYNHLPTPSKSPFSNWNSVQYPSDDAVIANLPSALLLLTSPTSSVVVTASTCAYLPRNPPVSPLAAQHLRHAPRTRRPAGIARVPQRREATHHRGERENGQTGKGPISGMPKIPTSRKHRSGKDTCSSAGRRLPCPE